MKHATENYFQADDCLFDLQELPQSVLYVVVRKLYTDIYGDHPPEHMRSWSHSQLMGWFEESYKFDPVTQQWDVVGVTLH
jgi:hypothetical protein